MSNKCLHIISYANAFKYHISNFYTTKKCTECGSFERAFTTPTNSSCSCAQCYPIENSEISYQTIYLDEKIKNYNREKIFKNNWGIPVVYGGYNTVK